MADLSVNIGELQMKKLKMVNVIDVEALLQRKTFVNGCLKLQHMPKDFLTI